MNVERMILCLLCGAVIGLLAGSVYWKYAEKNRRKRLPICEVRKAPKIIYVPEQGTGEASSTKVVKAAQQEKREPDPAPSYQISLKVCSREFLFGVRHSNPNQQQSPVLPHSDEEQAQKESELQNAGLGNARRFRLWITVSAFCCGGIGLLHTVRLNRSQRTPVKRKDS